MNSNLIAERPQILKFFLPSRSRIAAPERMLRRFDVLMLQHRSLGRTQLLSGMTTRESDGERRMHEADRMAARVADDARTRGPPDATGYSLTSAIIVRGLAGRPAPATSTSTQLSYHCMTPALVVSTVQTSNKQHKSSLELRIFGNTSHLLT